MKRSDIKQMPDYFDRYINLVEDVELIDALEKYGAPFFEKEKESLEKLGDNVYAPSKWTIKDLLQHMIDAERVFAYRAMRFSRNDSTPVPGFNENLYAQNASVKDRTVTDLIEEFRSLRNANILFFKNLSPEALLHEGTASENKISVIALGFTMCGHIIHHMGVIKQKYYPLLNA